MEIKRVATKHHLDIKVESSKGIIQISGFPANVSKAADNIHRYMNFIKHTDTLLHDIIIDIYLCYHHKTCCGQHKCGVCNLQPKQRIMLIACSFGHFEVLILETRPKELDY
jgi:hypothetical protein